MSHETKLAVPPVLQQKCVEVNGCKSSLAFSTSPIANAKIIFYRGVDTKYLWTFSKSGKFILYQYFDGVECVQIKFVYHFGPSTNVTSVAYFPASDNCRGIAVAVSDYATNCHYVAYFSLRTCNLLKCYSIPYQVMCLHTVFDGITPRKKFQELSKQFHNGWNDILLVGCRQGHAYLIHLDVASLCARDTLIKKHFTYSVSQNNEENGEPTIEEAEIIRVKPVRAKQMIPLTKIFHGGQMFMFHSDEGRHLCLEKENVYVSALYYLAKSKLIMIGFNFGGVIFISLSTSKLSVFYFGEGIVKFFAVQEPEDDPRPILYYWTCVQNLQKGTMMILSTINFPKDEANTKDPNEYTYLEPVAYPILKWCPDNCDEMLSVRTLHMDRRKMVFPSAQTLEAVDESMERSISVDSPRAFSDDTSLLLMVWRQRVEQSNIVRIHGCLFDLNAFYAKRLSAKVVPDNTVAKQYPFLSRFRGDFFADDSRVLDAYAESVFRCPAPAFLKDSIDQLFYPSTFYITLNLLKSDKFFQATVSPIQHQLVSDLTENIVDYFAKPSEPSKWICAVGLANSTPAENVNEERACLLRALIHIYLPGVLHLISAIAEDKEGLKYIQRWIWKEIELTKTKFDELCSPLFVTPSMELSPNARGYIHHAKTFFRRACLVLEALISHVEAFDDQEWKDSIALQFKATRLVEIFSLAVTFGLCYNLLPFKGESLCIHRKCIESMKQKFSLAKEHRKKLEIYKLITEFMRLNPDESIWNDMDAESWFPPAEFAHFLPPLLFMNVSEVLKISLLGYYCLEFDNVMSELGIIGDSQERLFEHCCSFLMQDNFSLELQTQICRMWHNDKNAVNLALALHERVGKAEEKKKKAEEDLYWLPLRTSKEIMHAKSEYLKLDYGIHKFNRDVIEKRRFNLIIEPPLPSGTEPIFVVKCRERIVELKAEFPWLFEKVEPLPASIVKKFRQRLALENAEIREKVVHVAARKISKATSDKTSLIPKKSGDLRSIFMQKGRKRKAENGNISDDDELIINDTKDETLEFEELPLTIATPAKRQRLMLFNTPKLATTVLEDKESRGIRKTTLCSELRRHHVSIVERLIEEEEENNQATSPDLYGGLSKLSRFRDIACSSYAVTSPVSRNEAKGKEWDRINRIIQTPISLKKRVNEVGGPVSRIPIRLHDARHSLHGTLRENIGTTSQANANRDMNSPLRNTNPPETPASILKTDKKMKDSAVKPKLRFQNVHQTESIPSRAENLFEEARDNSFTTFGAISESSSSSFATPTKQHEITKENEVSSIGMKEITEDNETSPKGFKEIAEDSETTSVLSTPRRSARISARSPKRGV